jgi:RAB protein geranylgeranyltransferase component A
MMTKKTLKSNRLLKLVIELEVKSLVIFKYIHKFFTFQKAALIIVKLPVI